MGRLYLNRGWTFDNGSGTSVVDIPHTVKDVPLHYFDESEYQMLCEYRNTLTVTDDMMHKTLLLTFEGVAHSATVYVNGEKAGEHRCGYTAFTCDITKLVHEGDNDIAVSVDTRENQNIPPFGHVIDYMTFGGMYRDVYLDVKETSYLRDVFLYSGMDSGRTRLYAGINVWNPAGCDVSVTIMKDGAERPVVKDAALAEMTLSNLVTGVIPWSPDHPVLYDVTVTLSKDGNTLDTQTIPFGFRSAEFRADGFYLNGEKLKIRGLNRHQSYPYAGYAMPKRPQVRDAEILKYELGLNAVRTSHYPQSQDFIDACDRLGLLVFTELPGWQHIGDDEWKAQAVQNVKDMVLQYRNHPSIVLWGVRINESQDDHDFYVQTNKMAHALDPTRATGGVRASKKSELLEDVYTYNDFSHSGDNAGCEKKKAVTSDVDKAYMVSEYNGHMYPTKMSDPEDHLTNHLIRHAKVLDGVAGEDDIAGSFGWCFADYNTHKDFGSGDRICYHGVMDMFRNKKPAAWVYAAEGVEEPVLFVSSSMDIGEHPASSRGIVWIVTNADSVKMYKNETLIKEYRASESSFSNLAHGPVAIDDYVGDRLNDQGYTKRQAQCIKDVLNAYTTGGGKLSAKAMAEAALLMSRWKMTFDDALDLFNVYIGDWGGDASAFRFEAIKDGKVVKTVVKEPAKTAALRVDCDTQVLEETHTYDVASVRMMITDQNDNPLYFANEPVVMQAAGCIELIGPSVVTLMGGHGGTYVKSTGTGEGTLTITFRDQTQTLTFQVKGDE